MRTGGRTIKTYWGEQRDRHWDGIGYLGTPFTFPKGSEFSADVQEIVSKFMDEYTSVHRGKLHWATILWQMRDVLLETGLARHAHPPIDFCPIPASGNHKNKPLSLWFEGAATEREVCGVQFPSRATIMSGCYCCPTFFPSTSSSEVLRFNGDVREHAKANSGTLLDYLVQSVGCTANEKL